MAVGYNNLQGGGTGGTVSLFGTSAPQPTAPTASSSLQVASNPGTILGANFNQGDYAGTQLVSPPATTQQQLTPQQLQAQQQAAAQANYVAQLQGQLGQLDPQQAIGLQNIADSYNLQSNRLDQNKAVAQRNYDQSLAQNDQSYSNNRNGIVSRTRANQTALQRLLGINGAGNSSAAYEQAPYAAALQGSTDLNQAQQVYGNNANSLETNWQDTQRGYNNAFDDLNNQKYQQENSLRASIAQTRANILSQMDNTSNSNQYGATINDLLSQITNLGKQYAAPVLRAADVAYKAPTLANYFLNGNQAQAAAPQQQQGGAASDINPTFLGLLGQQRDQFGNIIQA